MVGSRGSTVCCSSPRDMICANQGLAPGGPCSCSWPAPSSQSHARAEPLPGGVSLWDRKAAPPVAETVPLVWKAAPLPPQASLFGKKAVLLVREQEALLLLFCTVLPVCKEVPPARETALLA